MGNEAMNLVLSSRHLRSKSLLLRMTFAAAVVCPEIAHAQRGYFAGTIFPPELPSGDTFIASVQSGGSGGGELMATCQDPNNPSTYLSDTLSTYFFGSSSLPPLGLSIVLPSLTTSTDPANSPIVSQFSISASTGVPAGKYLLGLAGTGSNTENFPSDCSGVGGLYNVGVYSGVMEVDVDSVLTASRQSLTSFSLSGSPATGFSGFGSSNPTNGQLIVADDYPQLPSCYGEHNGSKLYNLCPVAAVAPGLVAGVGGNFTLSDPANPAKSGSPTPGQLGVLLMSLNYGPEAPGPYLEGRIATFGMSCYYTISQSTYGQPDQNGGTGTCVDETIHGTLYHGATTNPFTALPGTFCSSFIAELELNGSAIFDYAPYIGQRCNTAYKLVKERS